MAFPIAPSNGEITTVNGIVYVYDSTKDAWTRSAQPVGNLTVSGNINVTSNVSANRFYTTDGLYWAGNGVAFSSGGGGGTLTASNTAPSSPNASDFWYYIAGDILFQYIDDGDSEQWVDTSSPVAPTSTVASDLILSNVSISSVYNINSAKTALGVVPTASSTPPSTPLRGDFWYNTNEDILYQYTFDGSTNYWVDISSSDFGYTTNTAILLDTVIQGNLIPAANITYNLGSGAYRFKDLFLSGSTIDLGGATIKTDAGTGAVALIPQPTSANPNPTGIVVSPAGTISTVATTGGALAANAIGNSSNTASTSSTTSFANISASGNITASGNIITTGRITASGNIAASSISATGSITTSSTLTVTDGIFWSNGTAFSGGTSTAKIYAMHMFFGGL